MLKTVNGVPVAEMPQRYEFVLDGMMPTEDGEWVRAEDVQALVNQFNLLAQLANAMIPKSRHRRLLFPI